VCVFCMRVYIRNIYEFLCCVRYILQTESYNARNYSENVWIQSIEKSIERYEVQMGWE